MSNLPDYVEPDVNDRLHELMDGFFQLQCRYQAAIREVQTKLENLDQEFQMRHQRNPIHSMQSRLKSLDSIVQKLQRKGIPISLASAMDCLTDIAGIRVICSYIDDIYTIAALLKKQDDVRIIRERDYIKTPKQNGYRSLHLVIEIPVFFSDGKIFVPVEVQIRTIAMDFWATLEHSLSYKEPNAIPQALSMQLQQTADDIAILDKRMQTIYDAVDSLSK